MSLRGALRRRAPLAALGLAVLGLAGCAMGPRLDEGVLPARSIELEQTPFFAQTENHCGPAALATVLVADGVQTDPDQLSPLIFLPGRKGSLQAELLAVTRRFQRLPVRLEPQPAALFAALEAGQPVLVLQNLGLRSLPQWHYAVVVGFDAESRRMILRSGAERREQPTLSRFLQSWEKGGYWAVIPARPETMPAFVPMEAWIAAAAPFESLGQSAVAERAYEAALQRAPQSALAWQAAANTRYARGDRAAAEQALHRAVQLAPDSAASRNNLASVLLERGCVAAARGQIDAIVNPPTALQASIERTRGDVARAEAEASPDAAECAVP